MMKEFIDYLKLQKELGYGDFPVSCKTTAISVSKSENWNDFQQNVLSCQKCSLAKTRTQVVFGTGNKHAKLMFIGEAPGFDEDRLGEPFVGKAGELLTKIIDAMGLERKDVYIANIIKCRPPENRNPNHEEIGSCYPYLLEQINWIKPHVICALGSVAVQTLLGSEEKISRLRGKFFDFHGIQLMPTFHPAYLLRNPEYKREVWMDMKKILELLKKDHSQ
ncbi:MAG: uracil-DNA glycosylase [Chlamydiota bacterium]|nr:uracil-DNA glycosylase [Chlamydiota bacterium]